MAYAKRTMCDPRSVRDLPLPCDVPDDHAGGDVSDLVWSSSAAPPARDITFHVILLTLAFPRTFIMAPKTKNHGRRGGAAGQQGQAFPAQFRQYPIYKQTFEFKNTSSNATTAFSVPTQNLFGLLWSAATSTAGYGLADTYRILAVEIWAAPEQATEANSWRECKLEYLSESAPGVVFKATGNVMKPAHLHTRPPSGSLASFWHNQFMDATPIMVLTLGPNDIVRVHLQYTMANGSTIPLTAAGATPGNVYLNFLDATSGSPNLQSTASLQANAYP